MCWLYVLLYVLYVDNSTISYLGMYSVYTNFRLLLIRQLFHKMVCKIVPIFLKSVEREDPRGRGGEKEEKMAMQSYHVLNP